MPLFWAGLCLTVALTGPVILLTAEEPYQANWESLQNYECPVWFQDAKFGIYAHWGVYSATKGSRNTDWYSRNMYKAGHPNRTEHEANHGPVSEVGYKDLIPLFKAENFDADEWVDLYVEAGARFAGPVGEHADGFAMWDSKVNPWNAVAMGPHRNVVAEMESAVRKRGLKFMVSMHHQWRWGWYPTWDKNTDASDPKYSSLYGPGYPATAQGRPLPGGGVNNMVADPLPSMPFQKDWLTKVEEVVTGYSPDLLWFDNRMQLLSEETRAKMAAGYYNHALANGQQPVLTYKRPDMPLGTATSDLERARMPDIYPEPWLTDTSISRNSWSYANNLEYYSADRIVDDLVDIVSKNGCMLLNIAPRPDGTIPAEQKQILRDIGKWLRLNGESVYGSRPWLLYGEGPTQTPVGHLSDFKFNGFTSRDIRFTTKGGNLYAIALGWPEDGKLTIESFSTDRYSTPIVDVQLLGYDGTLTWKRTTQGLEITLPDQPPCDFACVFKIQRSSESTVGK
ncbi:alpha-L-fucosidase [Neorhodopirellula lusitana]|uniref:alpha-L-fucosidase n=1 Tax=Neorhodopirellula lusitana TaxID=445327 RepID=A0ABY1QRI4_9BACT|nr:alpha-L-fucosidase [Neorhodopirellula lusitana]SMP78842.1 alpha-L-fucosidase [Neorhodopirellula lusitana]